MELEGKVAEVVISEEAEPIITQISGEPAALRADKVAKSPRPPKVSDGNVITAMLPGTVVKVLVKEGSEVKPGDPILILEAMKMENEVVSPIKGIVKDLRVKQGDKVETGDIIAVIG